MNPLNPIGNSRVVIVTRPSLLEVLIDRYGTRGQVEFILAQRGQTLRELDEAHAKQDAALGDVQRQISPDQARVKLSRQDLPQFIFRPSDQVIVVGQDGLVANVAKYLAGQAVMGVNPDRSHFDGVLCRLSPAQVGSALRWLDQSKTNPPDDAFSLQGRTMAQAVRDDGSRLLALNEIFVGHRSHQSAKYLLEVNEKKERQSSSGMICATGSGATGWVRSITTQRQLQEALPAPCDSQLAWFVREPFPSIHSSTTLDHGQIDQGQVLRVWSEMGEGGTLFADGIEQDPIEFLGPQYVDISVAKERLQLLVPQ